MSSRSQDGATDMRFGLEEARRGRAAPTSRGADAEALQARCEALERASHERSALLTEMSHELRTPLAAIIGFAEILFDGRIGSLAQEQQEFMGDILSSSRHLMTIVNEVLDLSRLDAGRLDLRPSPVLLAGALSAAREAVRGAAAARRVEVAIECGAGEVSFDPARLAQSLAALLGYAVRTSPEGGRVLVRASVDGRASRVELRCAGPALDRAARARLFTSYAPPARGACAAEAGGGLGLLLARRFLEAHGGSVGVVDGPAPARSPILYAFLPRAEGRREARPEGGASHVA